MTQKLYEKETSDDDAGVTTQTDWKDLSEKDRIQKVKMSPRIKLGAATAILVNPTMDQSRNNHIGDPNDDGQLTLTKRSPSASAAKPICANLNVEPWRCGSF